MNLREIDSEDGTVSETCLMESFCDSGVEPSDYTTRALVNNILNTFLSIQTAVFSAVTTPCSVVVGYNVSEDHAASIFRVSYSRSYCSVSSDSVF
jgi:hypothetical protein